MREREAAGRDAEKWEGAETAWGWEHQMESKDRARHLLGWNGEKVPWFCAGHR